MTTSPERAILQLVGIVSSGDDSWHRRFWRCSSGAGDIATTGEDGHGRYRHFQREDPDMSYDGGKGGAGVYQQIINQIPPHRVYIEPFLGAGAVLRAKLPASIAIGVDADDQVIEHWAGVPGVTVICDDAISFLRTYHFQGDEFVYCDPPYLMSTRSTQRPIYRREFATIEEHRELLTLLRSLPCNVAISGYWSWLYEFELAGWRSISFQTVKRSGRPATEWLWMNYPEPIELHDYRYLGQNFRERERIKRKKQRWTARLRAMPNLERYALLDAIAEVRSTIASCGGGGPARACIATADDDAGVKAGM